MRIVGGALSGRRFAGPPGEATRPTSERVREAIASAIESRGGFEDTQVLDLYAGSGAMAFEALSLVGSKLPQQLAKGVRDDDMRVYVERADIIARTVARR